MLFTYTLPFHAIFQTESLPLPAWLWLVAGAVLFLLVVKSEKLVIRSIPALKKSVTPQPRKGATRQYHDA